MLSISRTPSIYQIRHTESGKVYIGSAADPRKRCYQHRHLLRKGKHHSLYLQRAWNKYGEDAFVFEIIEPVLFIEDLVTREQYWIDVTRAADPQYGFNRRPIAGSQLGLKRTDEQRAANSAQAKKRTREPAARAAAAERAKRQMSDPTRRAAFSAKMKVFQSDPAVRAANSARAKARFTDPAVRAANAAQREALYADPTLRAKQAERARAQWADPVYRAKHADARKSRQKKG